MLAVIKSGGVSGMEGYLLEVEVDVSAGLPAFDIVGLPDTSVKESKERVRAALRNAGFDFPLRRITVNLAPTNIRKEGSALDLPIAVGILAATGQLANNERLARSAFSGELSLEGGLRPIRGALVMADCLAKSKDIDFFYLPHENATEAAVVGNLPCFGLDDLAALPAILQGETSLQPAHADIDGLFAIPAEADYLDMADVKGQEGAKRALEIAAAGGHNLLLVGPPGSGKTMLARRLPTILPPLTLAEAVEISRIYSIAGLLPPGKPLITRRPFRAPHHGASSAAIIGGGSSPRPGEISLATHGLLFMDEMPEFNRDVLEALRAPLEDRVVTVSRVQARVQYPADFQLVGAMNPCPCGHYGDREKECTCTPYMIKKYLAKISGPLWDRIDLHIQVPRLAYGDLSDQRKGESSAKIRARVEAARQMQAARFQGKPYRTNAGMARRDIPRFCTLDAAGSRMLEEAFQFLHLSARAHDRILKIARTIADLAQSKSIAMEHLAEAISYRSLDREME